MKNEEIKALQMDPSKWVGVEHHEAVIPLRIKMNGFGIPYWEALGVIHTIQRLPKRLLPLELN